VPKILHPERQTLPQPQTIPVQHSRSFAGAFMPHAFPADRQAAEPEETAANQASTSPHANLSQRLRRLGT
jgi:hypothetical protein